MRDPLAPIPSPYHPETAGFWTRPSPPPTPGGEADDASEGSDYDPTRLIRGSSGDTAGIDRRGRARDVHGSGPSPTGQVIAAQHRKLDAVVGLCTVRGWVLVRTLSMAPGGVLVRLLDLLDRDLDPDEHMRGRATLCRLAPVLGAPLRIGGLHSLTQRRTSGSPLMTVGQCLLAPRVMADLSSWSNRPHRSSVVSDSPLSLRIVIPTRPRLRSGSGLHRMTTIVGELSPLTDPQPNVLAIELSEGACKQLELAIVSSRGNRATPRRSPAASPSANQAPRGNDPTGPP